MTDEPAVDTVNPNGQQTRLQLRLPNVQPADLSLGELSELLRHTEAAINAQALAEDPDTPPDDLRVSLVSIHEGSTGLDLSAPERAVAVVHGVTDALRSADVASLAPRTIQELAQLQGLSTRLGSPIEFREGGEGQDLLASVQPNVPLTHRLRISGETDVYGTVLRVGGVQPRAFIELHNGRKLSISLASVDLACRIAPLLYQTVGLQGAAEWYADTWDLASFRATDLLPYREGTPSDAFAALRAVAGLAWDSVDDVKSYLDELRGDDE